MLDVELKIINRALNTSYEETDIYLDNNVLVEKVSGMKIELDCQVFCDINKVKRQEHLRKFGCC